MATLDWDRVAFVISSDLRRDVLRILRKGERTPAQISKELVVPASKVSRTLSQLQRARLAVCITPHRRKERVYCLTERGYVILERLKKMRGKPSNK